MNDIKYVMLPRIEDKPKEIKQQPWYKERMREKYITKNPNKKEKLLDAKQWVFIKDGLDDFRDGLPPPHDDFILKPSKGPAPNIKNDTWTYKESALSPTNRLSLHQRCYSKKLPLAQAKRDYIENIINDLSQHPLALYSHLEDALPPDLFDEILDILDPEINEQNSDGMVDSQMHISSASISKGYNTKEIYKECKKIEEDLTKKYTENRDELKRVKLAGKNNYKWLLKKEELKNKAKGPDPEQVKAQAIDDHIKRVTEDYCNWVKSVNKPPEGQEGDRKPGGEHNIDPTTITSLFASGYETKPPLSVPINVVEINNIPNELRSTAYAPENSEKDSLEKSIYREDNISKKDKQTRYGAWYLPKEHWRLMPATEKLTDPKIVKDTENKESKKKTEEINTKLAPLYGARAFKDYIKTTNPKRVPKLIEELETIDNGNSK